MTAQIGLLLILLAVALLLFSFEWVSVDIVGLGLLLALIFSGLIPADRAFAGFGSDTVMLIFGLLILTAALVRTGVVEIAGRAILDRTGSNPNRILLVIMGAGAGLSSVMSNTAATAFFVPIVIGLAKRARVSASKLLMPLAFSTILASSVTLIGTSTNVVVSGMMTQYGLPPMSMFELTGVGIPVAILGVAYMYFVGRRIIPERDAPDELTDEFNLHPYLTEVQILDGSSLIGKSIAQTNLGRDLDLNVIRVERGEKRYSMPLVNISLEAGDVLLVEGHRDNLLKIKQTSHIGVDAGRTLSDTDLETDNLRLAEVILLPRSPLIGRRLESLGLREQYGLQVLAINRHEETLYSKISQVTLHMGDVLLVQAPRLSLAALERNNTFRILGTVEHKLANTKRARIAVLVFLGVIAAAVFNLISLPVAVLTGALLAFLTGCITPQEAYNDVEWKALILIGSMLAFGVAMDYTGTAHFLADGIVRIIGQSDPVWLLSGFFWLTVLLTQPMSNQAAAVVVFPVAIQTALQLGLNPRAFAMMIALAASTSFITPLEPACLIIYGLGRYRFSDFTRVGLPLTLLIYLVTIYLVPRLWPL